MSNQKEDVEPKSFKELIDGTRAETEEYYYEMLHLFEKKFPKKEMLKHDEYNGSNSSSYAYLDENGDKTEYIHKRNEYFSTFADSGKFERYDGIVHKKIQTSRGRTFKVTTTNLFIHILERSTLRGHPDFTRKGFSVNPNLTRIVGLD